MELLWQVERFLKDSGMTPSGFGRQVMRDPRFVHDLRRGREPTAATVRRIEAYMAART